MLSKEYVEYRGDQIPVYRYTSDINGNPRYIVHYLAIGLPDHVATAATRRAGFRIFHGRAFGGGFIFQSYYPQGDMPRMLDILNK